MTQRSNRRSRAAAQSKIKLVFLGGLGEIGKNMTCIESQDSIIVIDGGMSFPKEPLLGVDFVIPNYDYLKENKDKLKAFCITHGHEDHIGALPVVLKDLADVPVYGSPLTLALLDSKLKESRVKDAKLVSVMPGDIKTLGSFRVEFLAMTHSIAGALALSIDTPVGKIFHTGDFKIDQTPIDKRNVDLARFAEIGKEGVQLLMMDSTNVERSGYSMSEAKVYKALDNIFAQNSTKRIIVATFASNVHRVQQIMNCAIKYNRRIVFSGRSMEKISEIAYQLGELKYPQNSVVNINKTNGIPPCNLCIIATGTQGESSSALCRMSKDDFKHVSINSNDTVVLSSSAIPGNERYIYDVINDLSSKGADVIFRSLEDIHVSGHACKEELRLMFSLLKPKFFIPVHGEYRMLKEHIALAGEMGVPEANTIIPQNGMSVYLAKNGLKKGDTIQRDAIEVDGNIPFEEMHEVIAERKTLAESGVISVVVDTKNPDTAAVVTAKGIRISEKDEQNIQDFCRTELNRIDKDYTLKAFRRSLWSYVNKISVKSYNKHPIILPTFLGYKQQ